VPTQLGGHRHLPEDAYQPEHDQNHDHHTDDPEATVSTHLRFLSAPDRAMHLIAL
jgi:hypothetical protein